MQAIGAFLILIFQLSVGQAESKTFKQIGGDWIIDRVFVDGKEAPREEWQGKKVRFESESEQEPKQSLLLFGRLRVKGNMAWIETKSLKRFDDKGECASANELEYSSSFEVQGKTMKLLLAPVTQPSHRGPRPLADSKGEGGILLFLKRKS